MTGIWNPLKNCSDFEGDLVITKISDYLDWIKGVLQSDKTTDKFGQITSQYEETTQRLEQQTSEEITTPEEITSETTTSTTTTTLAPPSVIPEGKILT